MYNTTTENQWVGYTSRSQVESLSRLMEYVVVDLTLLVRLSTAAVTPPHCKPSPLSPSVLLLSEASSVSRLLSVRYKLIHVPHIVGARSA